MGIHGLMKLITEEAPQAIKEKEMENLNDRKVAIDASMAIYQFLVAVRSSGPSGGGGQSLQLTNEAGDVTSHIQGMFNRTIKMMESGVKPVYVFDGKPPQMKGGELAKRIAKRAKAETDLTAATEAGDVDEIDKYSRRLVKATRQHSEECKELLALMGVPFVNAPCEAEAQCAELAEKGKVYATATEDMDALTFRTPKLLRRFTSSQGKEKQPIIEVDFAVMLTGLGLTYAQFVDLCILCGCDYCAAIKGIGPKTALKLIKQHGTLEKIVAVLKKEKRYDIPPDWQTIRVSKRARIQAEEEAEAARLVAVERAEAAARDKVSSSASSSASSEAPVAGEDKKEDSPAGEDKKEDSPASEDKKEDLVESGDQPTVEVGADSGVKTVEEAEAETETEEVAVADPLASEMMEDEEEQRPEDAEVEAAKVSAGLSESSTGVQPENTKEVGGEEETVLVMTTGDEGDDEEFETIAPLYIQARLLFVQADVAPAEGIELKWEEPKEEALRKFLVERMGFNPDRVTTGIAKLQTAHRKKSQKRMDSFFTSSGVSTSSTSLKRKADDAAGKGVAKKGSKAAPAKKAGSKPGPKKR